MNHKYDRLLRYVVLSDGTNFGEYMIKNGFANEYTYNKPYKYQVLFKDAEKYAKNNKLGLWSGCSVNNNQTSSTPTSTNTTTKTETATPITTTPTTETPAQTPVVNTNEPCSCDSNNKNCPDFATRAAAQQCYDYCMNKTGKDIHKLDGSDKDGVVCESTKYK